MCIENVRWHLPGFADGATRVDRHFGECGQRMALQIRAGRGPGLEDCRRLGGRPLADRRRRHQRRQSRAQPAAGDRLQIHQSLRL